MSGLKMHLTSKKHREALPFIDLCSHCSEYIINEVQWHSFHITKHCIQKTGKRKVQIRNSQTKNSRVGGQWLRLYIDMFPMSKRLPSPCEFAHPIAATQH